MSSFKKFRCEGCKNEQVIFSKPSSVVNCLVCDNELATPTGGVAKVNAVELEILG